MQPLVCVLCVIFFFNDTATTEIYTLSLHDALPISCVYIVGALVLSYVLFNRRDVARSEEHTSELQSRSDLVCRLLLEKKRALDSNAGGTAAFFSAGSTGGYLRRVRGDVPRAPRVFFGGAVSSNGLALPFFFFNDTAPPEFSPLSLPAALPI